MDAHRRAFPALCAQMSLGCALFAVVCLLTMNQGGSVSGRYYPAVLLIYAPLIFGLNDWMLRRQRTIQALTLWNGGIWLALSASVVLIDGWQGVLYTVFAGLLCLCVTVQGVMLCLEPPTLPQLMLRLDISLLLLMLFAGCIAAMGFSPLWDLPVIFGCVCSMAGVLSDRVGGRLGGRGRLVTAAAFAMLLGLVWLLVRFVAAPAGGGILRLWETLLEAGKALGGAVARVLLFLLSLLPDPPEEAAAELPPVVPQMSLGETAQELPPGISAGLVVAAVLGIGIAVFFILRAVGRLRIGGRSVQIVRHRPARERISLLRGLRRLVSAWKRSLRLRLWLWRKRNTPAGLFFGLERCSRSCPWHRRSGETPRRFLCRLRRSAREDRELAAALAALAAAVDAAFYGPPREGDGFPVPSARLIRRRFKRAMWRHVLQNGLSGIRRGRKQAKQPAGNA